MKKAQEIDYGRLCPERVKRTSQEYVTAAQLRASLRTGMRRPGDRVHTLSGRAEGSSTTSSAWFLSSLRTDSVNRGFCISRFTLAIVVLSVFIEFVFFFIPKQ
jgi:hypothetical protein